MKLYAFERLEKFLDNIRAPAAQGRSFQEIKRTLKTSLERKEVEIKSTGIYCKIDGYEHQGYIFNQIPDIQEYKKLPKFHVTECDIVRNRKDLKGDYIWTNSEKVQLYDRGNKGKPYPREGELSTLELCGFCRNMIEDKLSSLSTTESFHKYLVDQYENVEPRTPVKTDIFGYTIDFKSISRKLRNEKNHICERCQIDLSDLSVRRYLHVHHRNGRKTDNKLQNLECLCIRCHSEVDKHHLDNFAKLINRRELDAFNKRFPQKRSI